jgi:hypothetical protein
MANTLTRVELNIQFNAVEDEINALSLQLEAAYAKRGQLRDALRSAAPRR